MGSPLPNIPRSTFERELQRLSPRGLDSAGIGALWVHYEELRRWNPRLSLIGPGTAEEVLCRHYGEALAAQSLLFPDAASSAPQLRELVDIGTGGGFPGLVLAAAVPDLSVTLVEPRQRKGAFLRAVLRKTSLPCTWLDGRVSLPLPTELPPGLDVLSLRALKLPPEVLAALGGRCAPQAQALFWLGLEEPEFPPGWRRGREVFLPGSRHRRILEMIVNPKEPVGTNR